MNTSQNPSRETIIGRRVTAWTGPKDLQSGTVTRVDGYWRTLVRWDDGSSSWYRTSDLTREGWAS